MTVIFITAAVINSLVWLVLVNASSPLDIGLGLGVVVSGWWLAVRVDGLPRRRGPVLNAAMRIAWYLTWRVIPDALASTFRVARFILFKRPTCRPGIVAVRLPGASDEALFLLSYAITLSPGQQVIQIDEGSRTVFVHAMNMPDAEQFRRDIVAQYTRYLKEL